MLAFAIEALYIVQDGSQRAQPATDPLHLEPHRPRGFPAEQIRRQLQLQYPGVYSERRTERTRADSALSIVATGGRSMRPKL